MLKQKYPSSHNSDPEVLLPNNLENVHPIKFSSIDSESVIKVTLKRRAGAGPSGIVDDGWKKLFTSNQFCDSTTEVTHLQHKKLYSAENSTSTSEPFLACSLIPLG